MTAVLRCTGKLARLLGERLETAEPRTDRDEWYANLLWIERRKCILFTHAGTLFSFLVPDVLKTEVVPFTRFFIASLDLELEREGLPAGTFGQLDPDDAVLAKTVDRSVLGSMNDLAKACDWAIYRDGGVRGFDARELNAHLRRTPMGAIGYAFPIEKTKERLAPPV